eukprot:TRINITY_DN28764_c0_g1_i1.p1 TRINITY_DN28764_c0_g1~~TRINITY_DN28764_c0_g1_i1.p1  ORF type:complete len:961 (-),score=216.85 TRINITY_DN28764_c0_g1_i1:151-2679(-)
MCAVAIACLQHYLRSNWTGPQLDEDDESLPFHPSKLSEEIEKGAEIMEELETDGEQVYELLRCPGYLWLSAYLLGALWHSDAKTAACACGQALPVWRARCAFVWQLSIAEASERGMGQCPSLFKLAVCDLVGAEGEAGPLAAEGFLSAETLSTVQVATAPMLKSWRGAQRAGADGAPQVLDVAAVTAQVFKPPERISETALAAAKEQYKGLSRAPATVRACIIVELANRLTWYNRLKVWDPIRDAACKAINFDFELTGVMGIKREYQTVEFAQLVVKAKGGLKGIEEEDADAQAPGTLSLKEVDDMTDILELPKLSKDVNDAERREIERPLSAAEQMLLLARCHYVWASCNPNDEMTLQEINALAQRVLAKEEKPREDEAGEGPLYTANWLSFSCGLWYRCRAEHHRNKTRERAAFQLQSLVEQFADEKPSAAHRLRVVHSTGYPARFHLQHEHATRMMKFGMVSTAHEQFKKLRMWQEAVDCLVIAERNVEAEDMIKDLLEKSPTPRLWCCYGDIMKEPKHYEKAWELSDKRHARAMRSLGRHHFSKKDLPKAIECFKFALEINPMFPQIWFTMGVAMMQTERMDEALLAFSRVIAIEEDDGQAWANLAAVHMHADRTKEARTCMAEATKRCRQNWRMWESFVSICMKLKDVQGVIQAWRRLIELGQMGRIAYQQLGMITQAVACDRDGLYEGRRGRTHLRQLLDFYKFATDNTASRQDFWQLYGELQDATGDDAGALDSRLKQCRALQARIWDENDPETFNEYLKDLLDCFKAIDETLDHPATKEMAKGQVQPFAYLVSDASKRLKEKFESTVQEPPWKPVVGMFAALSEKASKRCGESA